MQATIDQVRAVTPPDATSTWNPISHADFLDVVESELHDQGWVLRDHVHDLHKGGIRYTGRALLVPADNPEIVRSGDDVNLMLGWANFLDQSKAATILGGKDVFICSNGMMFAEHRVSGKHTTNVIRTLRARFSAALDDILVRFEDETARIERFKETLLPRPNMAELVLDARKKGAVPAADVLKVMAEYDAPSFEEFDGSTLWTAQNAFTTVARARFEKNPAAAADESLALSELFSERFALN